MRLLGRLLMLLGLLQVLAAATPLAEWWTRALAGSWRDPTGGTLVVFGNEAQTDGTIGLTSYWRAFYAVRAWREGTFQRMILCGGPVRNSAADAMRQFVISQGVDASRVLVDRASVTTRENAIEAKRLVDLNGDGGGVVLMTSDYHMFRALHAARKAGLRAQPRPIPDLLKRTQHWYERWDACLLLSVETSKIAYYWARGWI